MKNKFLLARYRKCNIENWKITIGNHKIDIFMPLHGSRNTIFVRGISSSGRALDLHSRGTGIDTRILQFCKFRQICWKTLQCCKMHLSAFSTRLNPCTRLAFDFGKCRDPGLNQGPSDLQSDALPTELSRQLSSTCCRKSAVMLQPPTPLHLLQLPLSSDARCPLPWTISSSLALTCLPSLAPDFPHGADVCRSEQTAAESPQP